MSPVLTHFWQVVTRFLGGISCPVKYGFKGAIPALINKSELSLWGTKEKLFIDKLCGEGYTIKKVNYEVDYRKKRKNDHNIAEELGLEREEVRQIVSGIAQYYTPEEMVGKKVVLVYNLKPAKLCGVESQGMILCADEGGQVKLVSPEGNMPSGALVR